jgi:hypothetical protein
MAKAVFAHGLPEIPQPKQRSTGLARAIEVTACRTRSHDPFLSYGFHRYAHLVQAGAEDYSVSPKISAVSGRDPWPL